MGPAYHAFCPALKGCHHVAALARRGAGKHPRSRRALRGGFDRGRPV